MIKIFPASLDVNCPSPRGSALFVKDLCAYHPDFTITHSIESADCILIPQYSNNTLATYLFAREKADYIASLKKPIIMHNDGGGLPDGWARTEIGEYIWGAYADLIKVFFSVECYDWHRKVMPPNIKYAPFDFAGNADFGLGLREVRPLQSKEEYLQRQLGTAVAMNIYEPTRDKLNELLCENYWTNFTYITTPSFTQRISGKEMNDNLYNAKIGFAPDGATAKTERHLFVPSYTAMMKQEDNVEFPFEWKDGINCLDMVHDFIGEYSNENHHNQNGHNLRVLNKEKTKNKILEWLGKPEELYEIYKNGYETTKLYELPNYFKNWIGKTIKENL